MALVVREKEHRYSFHFGMRKQEYFDWPAESMFYAIERISAVLGR